MSDPELPTSPLVGCRWLSQQLGSPELRIVEARMKPVGAGDDWETGHKLPTAVQMDINIDFSDTNSDLPHMLPGEQAFGQAASDLGLRNDSIIVLYDQVGVYGSARAWWMFRTMGHERVYVLDGGIRDWMQQGLSTEEANWSKPGGGNFLAQLNPALLRTKEQMLNILQDQRVQVLDARSQGRFDGLAPEPRAGLRGGHMPGAKCLPFQQVLNGIYLKTAPELKRVFDDLIQDREHLVTTCGSGVTAALLALAAEVAGYPNVAVYDGSWAEWGLPGEQPVTSTQ